MYFKWLFLMAFTVVSLSGCYFGDDDDGGIFRCEGGDGEVITRIIDLPNFDAIHLSSSVYVYLRQGPTQKVEVEGQENIIELLELDVQNDTWDIEFDRCIRDYKDFKVYITIPEITSVKVSGSGHVIGENEWTGDDLTLRVSGSGEMDLALDVDNLDSKISGSGRMRLEGTTDDFYLKISGSGDYNAFDLEALEGEVNISGSGDVDVRVVDYLKVKISGSGDLRYKGFPALDVNITGSGDVTNAN